MTAPRVAHCIAVVSLLGLGGCTITQTATPVLLGDSEAKQICVVADPRVFQDFLPTYMSALKSKGFSVDVLPAGSPLTSCRMTSTYFALRSWDFVTYMSHALIVVYRDGAKIGEALYDAPKAGTSMTLRIYETTESKVGTMVSQLFPALPAK